MEIALIPVKCSKSNDKAYSKAYVRAKRWNISGYKNNIFLHSRWNSSEEIY
nr:hypothetical protein [uncultured Bacteroides sp.]